MDISVDQPLGRSIRTYGDVQSYSSLSIYARAVSTDPSFYAMELVDVGVVPTRATSWGQLKSLYR